MRSCLYPIIVVELERKAEKVAESCIQGQDPLLLIGTDNYACCPATSDSSDGEEHLISML